MIPIKTTPTRIPAETYNYITYKLNSITYVPHYTKECYVGPGYAEDIGVLDKWRDRIFIPNKNKEFSAVELEKVGAKKVMELLWNRPKFKMAQ